MLRGGYAGKILRVDLSKRKVQKIPLDEELARDYIGGIGFCMKILYDETGPETDPLGPDNLLIFATGPLNGTIWPSASRCQIAAKSPLTGIIGHSNSGGHFSPALKFAGYDAIVIRGVSGKPVYLVIDDGDVQLKDASHLWGKTTWETDDILKEELGDEDIQTACIGPAGENLVRFSGIVINRYSVAARAGMGTVMGAKKLKAIAVRGTGGIRVAKPKEFMELAVKVSKALDENPLTEEYRKYGTTILMELMNAIGRLPTKNFQTGVFKDTEKIGAQALLKYITSRIACFACRLGESFITLRETPKGTMCGEHPEYDTLNALGSRVMINDLEFIIYAGWLCNQYGLDTDSFGTVMAFAMELWEKGIINEKDTGGIDFSWGNKETVEKMIYMISKREGFGNILAEGVKKAAEIIGRGAEKYAMHVKGLEIPAQDGRAQKSMGLSHATAARGADHLTHCCFLDETGFEDAIKERFGEKYLPEMADRLNPKYKGLMAKECETMAAIINSLGICVTGGVLYPPIFWWDEVWKAYVYATGIEISLDEFKKMGERICVLRRAYNVRQGLTRKDDTLPERFLKEPAPEGPPKGHVVELDQMLDEYYEVWGFDKKTGLIPRKRFEELGLKYVADELEALGKLPK